MALDLKNSLKIFVSVTQQIPRPDYFENLISQFENYNQLTVQIFNNININNIWPDALYNEKKLKAGNEKYTIYPLIIKLYNEILKRNPSDKELADWASYISSSKPYKNKYEVISTFIINALNYNEPGLEENYKIMENLYNLAKLYPDYYDIIRYYYPNNITKEEFEKYIKWKNDTFTKLLYQLSGDDIEAAAPEIFTLLEIYITDGKNTYVIPLTNSPYYSNEIRLVVYPQVPVVKGGE